MPNDENTPEREENMPASSAAPALSPSSSPRKGILGLFDTLLGRSSDAEYGSEPPVSELSSAPQPPSEEEEALREKLERDKIDSQVPAKGNKLYELCCLQWGILPHKNPDALFSLAQLMEASIVPNSAQRSILKDIEREVRAIPFYKTLPLLDEPETKPAAAKSVSQRPIALAKAEDDDTGNLDESFEDPDASPLPQATT